MRDAAERTQDKIISSNSLSFNTISTEPSPPQQKVKEYEGCLSSESR